jgi:hypothetical protein
VTTSREAVDASGSSVLDAGMTRSGFFATKKTRAIVLIGLVGVVAADIAMMLARHGWDDGLTLLAVAMLPGWFLSWLLSRPVREFVLRTRPQDLEKEPEAGLDEVPDGGEGLVR